MRSKRFLSTVVATALVATTMAMPVMAADGGSVDVDVTTKNAVIRVEVPTSLEIAVDQFEIAETGTQIHSTPFTMKNKSGVGVKVGVTSTATATAGLVATVDAVEKSTSTTGEAWLAVAAQTAAGSYGADLKDLTEASPNVATFDSTNKSAAQTFYLAKGTGDVEYKVLTPTAAGKVGDVSYAQFYELINKTTDIQGATGNEQSTLDALLAAGDVYVGTAAAADGAALTKVDKGVAHTYDAAEFYYTAADTVTEADDVAASTNYVYAGAETVGGEAAFRYIGRLSNGKTGAWTKSDISKVNIAYTIDGVTATAFEEEVKNCVNGLYTAPAALTVTSGKDNTDVVLKFAVAGKTLATNYIAINGVDMSSWKTLPNDVTFDASTGSITIKSQVFAYNSISSQTSNHKYTILVKNTDGDSYSTGEVDLTPAP
nr:hypothetical protein [uncultured Schaedlerella sp.]